MLQEIEEEYKFIVSKEEFFNIKAQALCTSPRSKEKVQVNYYFDTEDNYYNSIGQTIRVRQIENELKLQIKKHRNNCENYNISDEKTLKLETFPTILHNEHLNSAVYLKGSLVTIRAEFPLGKSSKICFDNNLYLGICDFEIEIEFSQEDIAIVNGFINENGLVTGKNMSKSERFFERLESVSHG